MTVQLLQAAQEAEFYALARYAFNKPQSPNRDAAFASLYAHSDVWGIGEPLQSGLLSTNFAVDFAGVNYKMSGIGYVASYPEAGGNGGVLPERNEVRLSVPSFFGPGHQILRKQCQGVVELFAGHRQKPSFSRYSFNPSRVR